MGTLERGRHGQVRAGQAEAMAAMAESHEGDEIIDGEIISGAPIESGFFFCFMLCFVRAPTFIFVRTQKGNDDNNNNNNNINNNSNNSNNSNNNKGSW